MLPTLKTEWMYYFGVLATEQSFQRAANRLHITQQALSNSILTLEEELGCLLVSRSKHEVLLTAEGRLFLAHVEPLLEQISQTEHYFRSQNFPIQGELRLAIQFIWHDIMFMNLLEDLMARYPGLIPKVYSSVGRLKIERMLVSGELDFACLSQKPSIESLTAYPLQHTRGVIVAAQPQKAHWEELAYIRFASNIDAQFVEIKNLPALLWQEELYPRQIVAEANTLPMVVNLCEAGLGALYIPEKLVEAQLASGRLFEVAIAPFDTDISSWLVWNAELPLSAVSAIFLEQLKQTFGVDF